ncbi:MAG TPA: CvpA family protein [Rectinemataceae bacterium]
MDWVFAAVVMLLAVRCFVRGFVQEILSVASYGVGLLAGLLFSNRLMEVGAKKLGTGNLNPTIQYIIAFAICSLAGFLVMKLVERLIREGLEAANLDIFDKILGLVLGIAEGLLVVSLALVIMEMQPFFDLSKLLDESVFADTILPIVSPVVERTIGEGLNKTKVSPGLEGLLKKKN